MNMSDLVNEMLQYGIKNLEVKKWKYQSKANLKLVKQ
jgi:hypothetical protein